MDLTAIALNIVFNIIIIVMAYFKKSKLIWGLVGAYTLINITRILPYNSGILSTISVLIIVLTTKDSESKLTRILTGVVVILYFVNLFKDIYKFFY